VAGLHLGVTGAICFTFTSKSPASAADFSALDRHSVI
jgi:hypothetical protein